ncbi:MAG: hypothetical protein EXS42_09135 [Lacunisphaera sp.]|nr:hypothetical protein [Lacunisphaera sp.]
MKKVYIIFPLIGLVIFGSFYVSFRKTHDAVRAEAKAKAAEVRKAKFTLDLAQRDKAVQDAIAASKKRELDLKERERIEEAMKNDRLAADDRRERTYADRNRLREQASRLKKELSDVKDTIKKIEQEKKHSIDEQTFLKTFVKQAETNVKYYYDLLDKITVAEKARVEAAAAAAAKKK